MKRGRLESAAEIIEETAKSPYAARTRILGRAGIQYGFLRCMLNAGLLETVKTGRRTRRLTVTSKGRELLQHYKTCDSLFPEAYLETLKRNPREESKP
jgi:predicted transcriptional regulator